MPYTIPDLWHKLPLAEAFGLFLNHTWSDESLQHLYDQHRGASYAKKLAFSDLVHWLIESLTTKNGRLHPPLQQHTDERPATLPAIYAKIRRMPRDVSHALVAADAPRLAQLAPELDCTPAPDAQGLARYRPLIFDGHTLKDASKRLQATRKTPGRALGGKLLAVLDARSNLVVGCYSDPHAHVNEQALLPGLLAQVRAGVPGLRLWIADRAFGNLANFKRCTAEGDACILRQAKQTVFQANPNLTRTGTDSRRRAVRDDVGVLESNREGEQAARQITVTRPGLPDLVIVTNLLNQDEFPADELLTLDAKRWTIEEKFQSVRQLFTLGPYVSSHPNGILFQAAVCLVVSNQLHVLQTLLASGQGKRVEEVSTFKVFEGLREQLVTGRTVIPVSEWEPTLADRLPAGTSLVEYVRELLTRAWRPMYTKSPKKKRHAAKVKHRRGTAGHFSIDRILNPLPPGTKRRRRRRAKDV